MNPDTQLLVNKLHSKYNPHSEAVRYIDSLNLKNNTECFILIEPGLGYIIPVLQEKFKTSKIIVLHIDNFPLPQDCLQTEIPTLYSTEPAKIQEFLETQIPEIDVDHIQIIEWRPSMNFYRESYVKLISQVVSFIKRTDAGNRTTAAFGTKWVRNFFRNLVNINKTILYRQTAIPVIVTGAGPSLEYAMPVIKKVQDFCLIIAASSSVIALAKNDITADIVITTDGGNWALKHIYHTKNNILAVNLCAALPSQCCNTPFLIINDGSLWQNIILNELSLPSVLIPQRGTVTATAVDLAMILSTGNIYLAGLDFSVRDIITHARPYSFDSLFFNKANRLTPVYSESFTRSTLIRQGGSLDIYNTWFKNQLTLWPKRIFSIGSYNGNNIFINGDIQLNSEVSFKELSPKNTDLMFKADSIKEDPALFSKRGGEALLTALKKPEYAQDLKKELNSLFFADEKSVTDQKLETTIKDITGKKTL